MKHKPIINNETGETEPMFRTPYNYDRDAVSLATGTVCEEETRTQQQFADECDINKIMERFGVTGQLPENIRPVMPDEYTEIFDFKTAMNTIRRAEEAFMAMPSGIRARFQNNPQVFTEFFADENNRAEAEKWGLVIPRKAPEVPAAEDQAPTPGDKKSVT